LRLSLFSRLNRPKARAAISISLGLALLSSGCLRRHRAPPAASRRAPPPSATRPQPTAPIVQGEEGLASWYGLPFHGHQTASGEIYNMYTITAAHRTLPFGTRVRVHNLENGSDVVVRINDRGPFVAGRIIDLSFAAAQAIRMPGTALVRLEVLGLTLGVNPQSEPGFFGVQVGAFKNRDNAERLKRVIAARYGPVNVQGFDRGDGFYFRVRVGRENSEDAARALERRLREASLAKETFVVRLN
jgi:peptidoglycan lytic transglycosylase